MPRVPLLVSVLVRFVVRNFSTNSRPALRAAACGGRPRPAAPPWPPASLHAKASHSNHQSASRHLNEVPILAPRFTTTAAPGAANDVTGLGLDLCRGLALAS
jgi:hypothetical protein